MDYTQSEYTLQAGTSPLQNVIWGLRKVFGNDPGLSLQLLFILPIIAGGIALHLNVIQWVLVSVVTSLYIVAGIFRRAALLQIRRETSMTSFHESRIRSMGNAIVMLTAGISLLTYLLIFVPRITQLL